MKFVVRPMHIISVGGYIVEVTFPYRNIIVVNPTNEPIKIEIPIYSEDWLDEHRELGLEVIPITEEESFLSTFKKAKAKLEKLKMES
ncbi:MAG: energy-converting hydrogenase B subunit P [Methanobacteriaceae archaeon]|jgi:energy-converting hydrogenase B subunit P|nr:MAG: hypothetical protein CIT01_04140 [Methanobacterium sp. BRmetb2]MCC7557715.1 energy-converting hydrogenase B subunit P [Methanobacteriaceae archaeon]